jgi:hypothetical protein
MWKLKKADLIEENRVVMMRDQDEWGRGNRKSWVMGSKIQLGK